MKTAVIIVIFRTPESEIERLRGELQRFGLGGYSLHIIDNTGSGRGFAEGVNEGIRRGLKENTDYFLVLNPDISLGKIRAADIMEAQKHFDVWGAAMRQGGSLYFGGEIDKWRLSGGLLKTPPPRRFHSVDFVTGSFMMIKRKVIDTVGLVDERYFMYYEDVDFCERARRAGFRIGIDAHHTYDHFETSRTYKKKAYFMARNRLFFLFKYGTWQQKLRELLRIPKTIFEERMLIFTYIKTKFVKLISTA